MTSKRDITIDLLRFIAIFLMIFAHTSMILNISGYALNNWLKDSGNFICFALFLFCFGAGNYLRTQRDGLNKKALLKRVIWLYFAYLMIVITGIVFNGNLKLDELIKQAFFYKLPAYGEFIAAFILFELFSYTQNTLLNKIASNISKILILSAIIFFLAELFKTFNYGVLSPYTNLLFGGKDYFSFPIMQYLPIFLLGVYYAKNPEYFMSKNFISILSLAITLSIFLFSLGINMNRWPPNYVYIITNISILFLIIFLANLSKWYISQSSVFFDFLKIINKYTIHILYSHILILYILRSAPFHYSTITTYIVTLSIIGGFYTLHQLKYRNDKTN